MIEPLFEYMLEKLADSGVEFAYRETDSSGSRTISEDEPRDILGVIQPASCASIPPIISACVAQGYSIYPISQGRNWGLGSRLPVKEKAALLDLSNLRRISIDKTGSFAVIEPGVTQCDLHERLLGEKFIANMTASSANSSVLGNLLERGMGFLGPKVDDLIGLEVILPSGAVVQIGGQPTEKLLATTYPHGLGPNLSHLFVQSNFGIISKATLRLHRKPDCIKVYKTRADRFEANVELALSLHRQRLLWGGSRSYSAASVNAYTGTNNGGENFSYFATAGHKNIVAAADEIVLAEGGKRDLRVVELTSLESDATVLDRAVLSAYHGDPTQNDAMIAATFGAPSRSLDEESMMGWLLFLPILPCDIEAISWARRQAERLADECHVQSHVTANIVNADYVDFVVGIRFRRMASCIDNAHRCLQKLHEIFLSAGFRPYRLGISDMSRNLDSVSNSYIELVQTVQRSIDPTGVISQGRYDFRA